MLKLPGPVVAWPLVTEIPLLSRREKIGKTAKSAIWIPLRRVTIRPATVATRGDDTAGSNTRPSTVQPGSASCNALRRPQFSLNIVISCNALCRFFPPPLSSPPWTVFASYFYYSAVGLRLPILPRPSFITARLAADDEFCLAALSFRGDNADCELLVGWEGRVTVFLSFDAFLPPSGRWILLSWNGGCVGVAQNSLVNFRNEVQWNAHWFFPSNDHFKLKEDWDLNFTLNRFL